MAIGETEAVLMRTSAWPEFGPMIATLCSALLCFLVVFNQSTATANTVQSAPDLCLSAAKVAAERTGVPLSVLVAVTLTETGRGTETGLEPWPWAVNQAGKGYWFPTAEEAVQFVEQQLDLGLRNFDVGCFQLNHRWHSKGFQSTIDMFDPTNNAIYAAYFLADLYSEKGDWSLAAAAYHSRTPDQADRYQAKFDEIFTNLGYLPSFQPDAPQRIERVNRFPLLQAGLKGNSGSIVPQISNVTPLIGNDP